MIEKEKQKLFYSIREDHLIFVSCIGILICDHFESIYCTQIHLHNLICMRRRKIQGKKRYFCRNANAMNTKYSVVFACILLLLKKSECFFPIFWVLGGARWDGWIFFLSALTIFFCCFIFGSFWCCVFWFHITPDENVSGHRAEKRKRKTLSISIKHGSKEKEWLWKKEITKAAKPLHSPHATPIQSNCKSIHKHGYDVCWIALLSQELKKKKQKIIFNVFSSVQSVYFLSKPISMDIKLIQCVCRFFFLHLSHICPFVFSSSSSLYFYFSLTCFSFLIIFFYAIFLYSFLLIRGVLL